VYARQGAVTIRISTSHGMIHDTMSSPRKMGFRTSGLVCTGDENRLGSNGLLQIPHWEVISRFPVANPADSPGTNPALNPGINPADGTPRRQGLHLPRRDLPPGASATLQISPCDLIIWESTSHSILRSGHTEASLHSLRAYLW
jgi:hypothetical protein